MTESLALLASSGNTQIDEITAGVLAILESHFPNRIRGYYFEGSCADGAVTPLSDIDLSILFIGEQLPTEQHDFAVLRAALKRISPRNLDMSCVDERVVLHADQLQFQPDWGPVFASITLKCASVLVYGDDIRPAIPFVPRHTYTRTFMHFPYIVLVGQRKNPSYLSYPLDYPDPTVEFFGYAARLLRAPDGTLSPSTKRLVHASGYIATALVALRTPAFVADKRTAIVEYHAQISDEWAAHLEAVHHFCRAQWGYRVPEAPADRAILRQLCQRQLAFENHFLVIYMDYLRHERDAEDGVARQFASERLLKIK